MTAEILVMSLFISYNGLSDGRYRKFKLTFTSPDKSYLSFLLVTGTYYLLLCINSVAYLHQSEPLNLFLMSPNMNASVILNSGLRMHTHDI